MHRFALPCLCGLALAVVAACGGASPDSFSGTLNPHTGGSSGAQGSSGTSSGSGSSGGTSSGGGSSGGGSSGSSSGVSRSSSGGSGGGVLADDSGDDAGLDSSLTDDAAEGSAGTQIACKDSTQTSYCDETQTCCITTTLAGTSATCQNGNACTGTTLHCADTADCPMNQVCCATGTTSGFTTTYTDVSCASTCPAGVGFEARYQVCDMMANDCPAGKTCTASTGLISYSVCR
jgi:hypothetical protein